MPHIDLSHAVTNTTPQVDVHVAGSEHGMAGSASVTEHVGNTDVTLGGSGSTDFHGHNHIEVNGSASFPVADSTVILGGHVGGGGNWGVGVDFSIPFGL